jgi:hypothetical protein
MRARLGRALDFFISPGRFDDDRFGVRLHVRTRINTRSRRWTSESDTCGGKKPDRDGIMTTAC